MLKKPMTTEEFSALGQEDGLDDATIIKRLQENAGMSLDQAAVYLKQ